MTFKRRTKSSAFARRLFKLFLIGSVLSVLGAFCVFFAGVGMYYHYSRGLPAISTLKEYRPPGITTVYSDDGRVIAELFRERRIVVPLSEIPEKLIQAFVAAEDARFYQHKGVDFISIVRAAIKNVEAGTVVQGGSTITQQVTKSFLLTPEKSYERKIKEAILASRIDKSFAKEDILYLYLNQIYLGHGAYGVASAAENYFGKPLKDLNLAECAMLAGLPQAPSLYSPFRNMKKAKERQEYVLDRMVAEGYIDQRTADDALKFSLTVKPRRNIFIARTPYYTEHVRRYIAEKYGEKALYEEGLKVYTAVNIEMQAAARRAVDRGLRDLDKRHSGYRGPVEHLKADAADAFAEKLKAETSEAAVGDIMKAVVLKNDGGEKKVRVRTGIGDGFIPYASIKWVLQKKGRKKDADSLEKAVVPGDVILVRLKKKKEKDKEWRFALEQPTDVQGALICIEAGTGQVKAMVGGRDFRTSQFNRAVQARRQPGSAFKPVIYAAAINKGYTPASVIIDNAFIYQDSRMRWKPKNYDRKFYGPTLLRKAFAKSRNLSTIQILDDIGVPYVIDYARILGVESDLSPNLSIALGSSGVSPFELTRAYSVFANGGEMVDPIFITKIEDRNGNILEENPITKRRVIDATTAYLMTSLMESVIKEGTATRVRAINRPAAGKTGTTNDLHDAWFVGYTPDYISGVWVGYDQERPLGRKESGGRAASPIWLDYMKTIHADKPVRSFPVPRGIVFSKIDAETGLLPVPDTRKTIFECFKEGTVPRRYSRRSDSVTETDQFFKADM